MRAHIGVTSIGLVVAVVAASTMTALGASPTAVWHMDETSGSVARDSTGHGYDGAMKSMKLGVPGVSGTGFDFNGTSSRIIVNDAPGLRAGDKDLVVTVSVSFTKRPSGDYDLIRKGLSSSSSAATGRSRSCRRVSARRPTATGRARSRRRARPLAPAWPTAVTQDHLRKACDHVALVVDGHRYSSTKTVGRIDNTAQLSIGAKAGSGGDWYKGRMDEVSVTIG